MYRNMTLKSPDDRNEILERWRSGRDRGNAPPLPPGFQPIDTNTNTNTNTNTEKFLHPPKPKREAFANSRPAPDCPANRIDSPQAPAEH